MEGLKGFQKEIKDLNVFQRTRQHIIPPIKKTRQRELVRRRYER